MPQSQLDRFALALVGLLVAAAGSYGLARGYGAFGTGQERDPVLVFGARQFVAAHQAWIWSAAGLGCLVIAVLALAWLRAEIRRSRPANDDLVRADNDGTVRLHGNAVADALAADVNTLPGVASATARLWGDPTAPVVSLRVDMHDDAPLDTLRARIETESLDRLCHALQVDHLDAHLDLRLAKPEGRTVR